MGYWPKRYSLPTGQSSYLLQEVFLLPNDPQHHDPGLSRPNGVPRWYWRDPRRPDEAMLGHNHTKYDLVRLQDCVKKYYQRWLWKSYPAYVLANHEKNAADKECLWNRERIWEVLSKTIERQTRIYGCLKVTRNRRWREKADYTHISLERFYICQKLRLRFDIWRNSPIGRDSIK